MGLISRDIQGLYNGVSQQAPPLRLANQCAEQINFHSTVAKGLEKRQGTHFQWFFSGSKATETVRTHFFKDSEGNEYLMLFTGNAAEPIEVYTLAGVKCTVTYEGSALSYLSTATDPQAHLRITSIADYTMVVNRKVTCKMNTSSTVATPAPFALYWCKKGVNSTAYYLGSGSCTTGDTSTTTGTNTANVCSSLAGQVSGSTWLNGRGSVIRITGTQSYIDGLTCSDSYGNQASSLLKGKVKAVEDLPPLGQNGDIFEVTGEKSDDFANYWVKFDASDNLWRECPSYGIPNAFDATTLPHQLIRTGATEFLFRAAVEDSTNGYKGWAERKVGDADSAPAPSFIDSNITDIFFYKNRLGILTGQNVILSRANDFFTFFPDTAVEVLDTDPLDMIVGGNAMEALLWAVPFNEDLLLFSRYAQYVLSSGSDIFSATSVSAGLATSYPCSETCRPVSVGAEVFFCSDSGDWSTVREYYTDNTTDIKDAANITAHCDSYVPKGLIKSVPLFNHDITFNLSTEERESLYIYKWYWTGKDKPQSAWYKFTLPYTILSMEKQSDEKLLLLGQKDNTIFLETLSLAGRDTVLLDRYAAPQSVTYDAATRTSTITVPYSHSGLTHDQWAAVRLSDTGKVLQAVPVSAASATQLTANGDWRNCNLVLGVQIPSSFTFSEFFVPSQKANAGMLQGRLQLRTLTVSYTDSGGFELHVTPKARDIQKHVFSNEILGASSLKQFTPMTGRKRFLLGCGTQGTVISLVNNDFLPSTFDSAGWEGTLYIRSSPLG